MAYMSVCGQYNFYKSLRGALASSANQLRNSSSTVKQGAENGTGSNKNSIGEVGGQGWR